MYKYVYHTCSPSLSHTLTVADGFSSKNVGLRIQKKVIGKFSTKSVAKAFIDDDFGRLLDILHNILKQEFDSKKADKIIKNLIKVTVKIGLLFKNNQFNQDELAIGAKLRTKLRHAALTVISFHEVDFTYDRTFLVKIVDEVGDMLHKMVDRHLSDKSHMRINSVVEAFNNGALLDKVFLSDGQFHRHLETISQGFHKVVDSEW